ncbi:uncharacterized protein MYCGRDRAFT_97533 [Zymoseptoria tritici IPO323]|uniref:Uncharacterized protein n=1 Tax=Zymoseptoria tritici (strain CBS 115943 / IPO323) TaxID=336722 RepID=F9XQI8_ZYMTI|nr:uncharacterized protein MYCGRDRAFT_97533 [Zymoseptoria tritici IPO323]EGP82481.1 hypothetical protein MYCGRDRAFT_97533 [Zymoseptoria tritici IPO323]
MDEAPRPFRLTAPEKQIIASRCAADDMTFDYPSCICDEDRTDPHKFLNALILCGKVSRDKPTLLAAHPRKDIAEMVNDLMAPAFDSTMTTANVRACAHAFRIGMSIAIFWDMEEFFPRAYPRQLVEDSILWKIGLFELPLSGDDLFGADVHAQRNGLDITAPNDRKHFKPPAVNKMSKLPEYRRWSSNLKSKIAASYTSRTPVRKIFKNTTIQTTGQAWDLLESSPYYEWHTVDDMLAFLDTTYGDDPQTPQLRAISALSVLRQEDQSFLHRLLEYRILCSKAQQQLVTQRFWLTLNYDYMNDPKGHTRDTFTDFCAAARTLESNYQLIALNESTGYCDDTCDDTCDDYCDHYNHCYLDYHEDMHE